MDKVVSKIAGLGVPGLVLLIVMSSTGYIGAAAITSALSIMGGPFGMLGGMVLLGILVQISTAISKFGFLKIYHAVIKELYKNGEDKKTILEKINSYPISKELKNSLFNLINDQN